MLKIAGLCIVLFTIYYVCCRVDEARHRRLELAAALSSLLDHLREGIALYMRPLPELYSTFEWGYLSEYDCPRVLTSGGTEARAPALWEAVGEELRQVLVPLFDSLGAHSYTEEIATLDRVRERVAVLLEGERAEARRSGRLVRTLGLSLSLAITILVI